MSVVRVCQGVEKYGNWWTAVVAHPLERSIISSLSAKGHCEDRESRNSPAVWMLVVEIVAGLISGVSTKVSSRARQGFISNSRKVCPS